MGKILFYFLCLLLLLSCGGKTENSRNTIAAPPLVEAGQSVGYSNMPSVRVTKKAVEHIINRHWSASDAQGAGKFMPEITVNDLKAMIETTASQGAFRHNTNGRPGKIAEYDFRKTIGITINGSPATRLRVVIAPNGNVITAFPY